VTITEAFIDSLTTQLFNKKVSHLDLFYQKLSSAAIAEANQSWDNRKDALRDYHGISVGDCKTWSQVDACITVRNAIAHGLGRLTARQRNGRDRRKVRGVGVDLQDDYLRIDCNALDVCVSACASLVLDVDKGIDPAYRG
jgi:hypothetical protein